MNYRRAKTGTSFFFTVVTYQRLKLFKNSENISLLKQAIRETKNRHPFTIDAFVLLPDHLHCIWTLPENDADFSIRWMLIKNHFSRNFSKQNIVQRRGREICIWQRRFWEHQIHNDLDFENHVNYIHYNPVKHKLCLSPKDWSHSSFHRYVKQNILSLDWGTNEIMQLNENTGHE